MLAPWTLLSGMSRKTLPSSHCIFNIMVGESGHTQPWHWPTHSNFNSKRVKALLFDGKGINTYLVFSNLYPCTAQMAKLRWYTSIINHATKKYAVFPPAAYENGHINCFRRSHSLFWCWRRNIPALGAIPCLLMPWLQKSPEHQQARYWLRRTDYMYSCSIVNRLGSC